MKTTKTITVTKITRADILQEIVNYSIRKKKPLLINGVDLIPQRVGDLTDEIVHYHSQTYRNAYTRLHNMFTRNKKVKSNASELFSEPAPISKPIAVPKLEAKKLVVNLSDTMTCTITSNGLITVDFK